MASLVRSVGDVGILVCKSRRCLRDAGRSTNQASKMTSRHVSSVQPSLQHKVSRSTWAYRPHLTRRARHSAANAPVAIQREEAMTQDCGRSHQKKRIYGNPTRLSCSGRLDGEICFSLRQHTLRWIGRRRCPTLSQRVLPVAAAAVGANTREGECTSCSLEGTTEMCREIDQMEESRETAPTLEITRTVEDGACESAGFLGFSPTANAVAMTMGLSLGVAVMTVLSHPDLARAALEEGSRFQVHDHQHAALDSDLRAFALGPGGPLMEDFWDNMRRYVLYFFTVATGGLYTLVKPLSDLLRRPATAVLVVVLATGVIYLTYATLNTMLGINQDFDYLYSQ
eukprot:TRINITY_DN2811_c0_g1_i2.p1 TRINITY_DN2811_c0_g1~~TRINITY_DN2811_c0_g1_i2.p1  ORF type:complete len:340 (-),score=22.01 TRINITY_DN2811_c0_g1_i2:918-1937(-)